MPAGALLRSKQAKYDGTGVEVSLAEAKAHFSEVVARVEQGRQPVTILRRGQAVAQIVPMQSSGPPLYGSMRGTIVEVGDSVGHQNEEWTVGDE